MKTSNGVIDHGMTWAEACDDPSLQNLPFKVEINRHGQIIMSPIRNRHSFYQGEIAGRLQQLLPHGKVGVETAVDCGEEGTRVADVTWASAERFKIIVDEISCSIAPEICVEVWSPSNSDEEMDSKRQLYLAKGASEFWYCDAHGQITHFDRDGSIPQSKLCPQFPKQIGI
jgi:Uma2 family endonuclease